MSAIQHQYALVNNIRIHCATAGDGPLLLLLHGFPEFWYSWHHQLTTFSPYFRVVAPDLRGYNHTDKPAWGYEADVILADVVELIKTFGERRAIVAGHGWGGLLAWALAILYPHRVEQLVILNAPHPAMVLHASQNDIWQQARHAAMALLHIPWLPEALLRANDYALVAWLLTHETTNKARRLSHEQLEHYKDAASKPGALHAMLNWYRFSFPIESVSAPHPLYTLFKNTRMHVDVPTLMLWGEKDHDLEKPLTYGTEQYVSDFHIMYLANTSHRILLEEPELVSRAMMDFLVGDR